MIVIPIHWNFALAVLDWVFVRLRIAFLQFIDAPPLARIAFVLKGSVTVSSCCMQRGCQVRATMQVIGTLVFACKLDEAPHRCRSVAGNTPSHLWDAPFSSLWL
jgi:hypothetical protein